MNETGIRQIKCKDTGEVCNTYSDYLRSTHWYNLKKRYRNSKLQQFCLACGTYENIDMHHRTYKRIGEEYLHDLVPLCRNCHEKTHNIIKVKELNLYTAHRKIRKIQRKQFLKQWKQDRKRKSRITHN